jgi:predicted DNA binding CopG/RHH family protein
MAKRKTAKTTTIPKFKIEAEEAGWWDAHPDFIVEQFEKAAKEGRLLRGIPRSKSITIRIPIRDLETAQRLADRKGLPCQTYMKMLLHQALEKERAAGQVARRC